MAEDDEDVVNVTADDDDVKLAVTEVSSIYNKQQDVF
jgi:hypothetical protein